MTKWFIRIETNHEHKKSPFWKCWHTKNNLSYRRFFSLSKR